MVPHTSTHVDRLSQTDNNRNQIMVNRDNFLMFPQLAIWHISGRDVYRGQQLLEEATELMVSSWKTIMNKSYGLLFEK